MIKHNKPYYLVVACLAVALVASLWAQNSNARSAGAASRTWQHLALQHDGKSVTADPELARKINQLGSDGWELVDVETIVDSGITEKIVFFFKKPQ